MSLGERVQSLRATGRRIDPESLSWPARLLTGAAVLVRERTDGAQRSDLLAGLSLLRPLERDVWARGAGALRDVLPLIYAGRYDAARERWLEEDASFNERRLLVQTAAQAAARERDEREADWARIFFAFQAAGAELFPYLLALL